MNTSNSPLAHLSPHYQTGRSFVISGTGKDRKYGYRTGVMCKLGDIEKNTWIQLVKEQITASGETRLFGQLLEFYKQRNYTRLSTSELEYDVLQSYARRIFDCPTWIYFIPFNRQYRPAVLDKHQLMWIIPECCQHPGEITKATYESSTNQECRCPHCGKWSGYKLTEPPMKGESYADLSI